MNNLLGKKLAVVLSMTVFFISASLGQTTFAVVKKINTTKSAINKKNAHKKSLGKKGPLKRVNPPNLIVIKISPQVIENLKANKLSDAIRQMRVEATSPQAKFFLREIEKINDYEHSQDKKFKKELQNVFNTGIAYHNLYLFLRDNGIMSKKFFGSALGYYKKAESKSPPSEKSVIQLLMAALYADTGDIKNSEKYYGKIDQASFHSDMKKCLTLALYYSSRDDVAGTIASLENALKMEKEFTIFWVGISDDFYKVYNEPDFQDFLKKWNIERLNKGPSPFSAENKNIVN